MDRDRSWSTIAYEILGSVVRISHNRPEVGNAESQELLEELDQAVRLAEGDPAVRAVIIGGKGKHFSSGHDLKAGVTRDFGAEERWDWENKYYYEYCLRILDMRKPTIAQVQGACIAGGFMVANVCDLVVASDDAFFADPVTHSLGTASIEVLIHPYVMGVRKAKEFLFTGERMGAEEAYRIGMVNRVVPRAELEAATLALAERVAAAPPFALRIVKRSLNRVLEAQGLRVALGAHFDAHQIAHATEEHQRIRRAGLDKSIQKAKAQSLGT